MLESPPNYVLINGAVPSFSVRTHEPLDHWQPWAVPPKRHLLCERCLPERHLEGSPLLEETWVVWLSNSLMFKKCWPLDVCCCHFCPYPSWHFRWIPGGGGAWKLSMLNGQLAQILLNHLSDVKEVLLVARTNGVGKIQVFVKVCCFTPYVWLWLILFSQKKG